MNDGLRHIQGDYTDMFFNLFPEINFDVYHVHKNHFPKNINQYECFVVNGSRHSVYEEIDWIIKLKKLVREIYAANKKYIGICFGHQLLAEALGGKVAKAEAGWNVGVHGFHIVKKEKWMHPFKNNLNLLMMCQDQVHMLPKNSTILADTANCPVGMFMVEKHMLGLQAHPEFSKAYDQALMKMRVERMGEGVVKEGIESLKKPLNADIMAKWLSNFLSK